MKAFFVKAPMQFEARDVSLAPLEPDEVLVQMKACGVCGWDILVAQEVAKEWSNIGHEVAGEVVEVGNLVKEFKPGDHVLVENSTYCGLCDQCKRGNVANCSHMFSTFSKGPGAFSECFKTRQIALNPAKDLDYRAAALAEPLTVAIDMVESSDIPLMGTVAVFGPGPIGLMIARLALLKGAAKVYLTGFSHSKARWNVASKIGIENQVFIDQVDLVEYFLKHEPKGVDRVLVTTPPNTINDATKICRYGGIIAYDGIKFGSGSQILLDGNNFHFKRLQLRGVHSIPNLGWPQAVELLRQRIVDPDLWISHEFPLAKVPEAVQFAVQNRDLVVKVMVVA